MKTMYEPLPVALVRTTGLPFENLHAGDSLSPHNRDVLDTAVAVASPSLFERARSKKTAPRTDEKRNLYIKRMSSRTTPFGLCAGTSLAKFAQQTNFCRSGSRATTHARLDVESLLEFIERIESNAFVRENIRYFNNPEVVEKGGRLWLNQMVSTSADHNRDGTDIKATAPVMRALIACNHGLKLRDLVRLLSRDFRVPLATSQKLCDQLCELTILISELRVPLCTRDPVSDLLKKLQLIPGTEEYQRQLESVTALCAAWDNCHRQTGEQYLELEQRVRQLIGGRSKNVIQVDSATVLKGGEISFLVAQEMANAAKICLRLSPSYRKHSALDAYLKIFQQRYPIQREVPLLELLNGTYGIGSPYKVATTQSQNSHSHYQKLISDIAISAVMDNKTTVELTEAQLKAFEIWAPTINEAPPSLDLFASISAMSRQEIDKGNFQLVLSPRIGDVGGSRAIARFTHFLGAEAHELVQATANADAASDQSALWINCAFWPTVSRGGNIAIVPETMQHSVNARCAPSTSSSSIDLCDVLIGVDDGQFYAKWAKNGLRLKTRSTNMLNPKLIPDPLRFLIDISSGDAPVLLPIDWGSAQRLPFCPRLTYGRIVIQRASWNMSNLIRECKKGPTLEQFRGLIQSWKTKWNVSDIVQVSSRPGDDRELTIDLHQAGDLQVLKAILAKSTGDLRAIEYIPSHQWHSTNEGHFLSELVVTLIRSDLANSKASACAMPPVKVTKNATPPQSTTYLRPPGSEWIYLKLNSTELLQKRVVERCAFFANELKAQNRIRSWFYIRYRDTTDHIRFRLKLPATTDLTAILPTTLSWANALMADDLCSSFSLETYDRELERYGGFEGITVAEDIFAIDSITMAQVLCSMPSTTTARIVAGVLSINDLLSSFGMTIEERCAWLETRVSSHDKRGASKDNRALKHIISSLLEEQLLTAQLEYAEIKETLDRNHEQLMECANRLISLDQSGQLTNTVDRLCHSFVHMRCNRLLGTDRQLERRVIAILASSLKTILMKQRRQKVP